ncbi:hypothetical protein [Blastococcus brunescens]|uniref:Uncharacterized protein n=1 Tax=Blastococcus brunescens TaxID=1564165 RepID=A0ABZ1B5P6_9ACTN|nr:hypothetical protein [Blastococcus sp. BMG 8361]WRL65687.1 hypothetical protein U6N30_08950 [Blastococcus sp. BMG 8361]
MTAELVLQIVLTVAAGLIGVGLFGALSQQTIVMVMMGLELVLNGVLLAGERPGTSSRRSCPTPRCWSSWRWWSWRWRWPWASPSPSPSTEPGSST